MPVVQKQSNKQQPPIRKGPRDSVIDRISGMDTEDETGLRCLIYGRSGSGKTTLAATFPAPILWIVCSGGKKPGELRSVNTAENRKRIKKVVIEKSSDLKEIIEHVQDSGSYKTVVLDHVSGLQDKVLSEVLGLEELPAQMGWGVAKQQDYGTMSLQVKTLLRELMNIDANVIMVGQERESHVEETSDLITPTVGVALTPSLAGWLNPACDFIMQTFIRPKMVKRVVKIGNKDNISYVRGTGVEYCLRTGPHDVYVTKFRCPKGIELPECLVDADYDAIMELINQ